LGEYIQPFDGIIEPLLDSQVAVTDASSAMIESALLGTPVVVTNSVIEPDIEAQLSMANIHFADPGDLGPAIESVLSEISGTEQTTPSFADGTVVDRIVEVSLSRSETAPTPGATGSDRNAVR
jgi:UDP-N-acetylglucosamine 2-epimerase